MVRKFFIMPALAAAFAAAFAFGASAQSGCTGQFANNTFCGRTAGTTGLPGPVTITPGTLGNIAGGTVIGNPTSSTAAPQATSDPVLGIAGSDQGTLGFAGVTSGVVTIKPQSAAGTYNFNLPTGAGTSGQPLLSGGGSSSPMTFGTLSVGAGGTGATSLTSHGVLVGSGTSPVAATSAGSSGIPLIGQGASADPVFGTAEVPGGGTGAVSFTAHGVIIGNGTSPLAVTATGGSGVPLIGQGGAADPVFGTATVPGGGTGITSGTSGGVPYFNSTTSMASSAALGQNEIVLGGGAGAGPASLGSLGTTTTVLHGNAAGAPTFGAVSLTADVSGILPLANGGTNANLTASTGGIVYSGASALAILSGTATAGQIVRSGSSAAPSWSTATYPSTVSANAILFGSSSNVIGEITSAAGGVLNTNGSSVPSITPTPTLGVNGGTGGQITLNGATSGSVAVKAAAAAGTGTIFQLPATNGTSGYVLQTDGAGVTSWVASAGGGTVTSATVAAGTGITVSGTCTITTTGTCTVNVDKATSSNYYAATSNKVVTTDIIYPSEVTVTYGATTTFDFDTFINSTVTLTGNITTMTCSNVKAGKAGTIRFVQDGAGSHTTVWCSAFKWAGGTSPSLSTAASSVDVLNYSCSTTSFCTASLMKAVN